jgi:hypothetical protein
MHTNVHLQSHDSISDVLGIRGAAFEDEHSERAVEMKRLVMGYVRQLKNIATGAPPGRAAMTAPPDSPLLEFSPQRFPIVPATFDPAKAKKKTLETLLRDYLSYHYSMYLFTSPITLMIKRITQV